MVSESVKPMQFYKVLITSDILIFLSVIAQWMDPPQKYLSELM